MPLSAANERQTPQFYSAAEVYISFHWPERGLKYASFWVTAPRKRRSLLRRSSSILAVRVPRRPLSNFSPQSLRGPLPSQLGKHRPNAGAHQRHDYPPAKNYPHAGPSLDAGHTRVADSGQDQRPDRERINRCQDGIKKVR